MEAEERGQTPHEEVEDPGESEERSQTSHEEVEVEDSERKK